MNENLNLLEILKNCPRRTMLYSPLYGDVELISIVSKGEANIGVETFGAYNRIWLWFRSDGRQSMQNLPGDAAWSDECMLFPSKAQRDWSKFKGGRKSINSMNMKEKADEYIGHPYELDEGVDTTMRRNAFFDGADWMRQKAMVSFEDAIRKLKSRLPEDMQAMFSVTEEMIKFNKSLSE